MCEGHGTCNDGLHCKCDAGYGGVQCEFSAKNLFWEHEPWKDLAKNEATDLFPEDAQGWWGADADLYESLMKQTKMRLAIEVGVWKGRSSLM